MAPELCDMRGANTHFMLKSILTAGLRPAFVALASLGLCWSLMNGNAAELESVEYPIYNDAAWDGQPVGQQSVGFLWSSFLANREWNGNPVGIWSDGARIIVVDWLVAKLFAYGLGSMARTPEHDFSTLGAANNRSARGLWSNGSTMWVADEFDDKLYAYDATTKERAPDHDFDTLVAAGNESPTGLWSDGRTMWVADDGDDKLYAYNFTTKEREPEKDFDTLREAGNITPRDMWSNGSTLWVADTGSWTPWGGWVSGKLYAYHIATRQRHPRFDIDYQSLRDSGSLTPNGVWANSVRLWIGDRTNGKIYVYTKPVYPRTAPDPLDPHRDLTGDVHTLASAGNTHPGDMWSDGRTLWVADHADQMIYAYQAGTTEADPDKDISLAGWHAGDAFEPAGLWSDGSTMWVADWHTARVYAVDLATKERLPDRDFESLAPAGNRNPAGMWSNGETLWVLDSRDVVAYAYEVGSGARKESEDIRTLASSGNLAPRGMWSDGTVLWVGDWRNEKLYAYDLASKNRLVEHDIELGSAGNLSASGLWSDGQTLWVADFADAFLYAYDLPTAPDVPIGPVPGGDGIVVRRSADGLIELEYQGQLQSATSVDGPFNDVAGALSPFQVAPDLDVRFFIAR